MNLMAQVTQGYTDHVVRVLTKVLNISFIHAGLSSAQLDEDLSLWETHV